MDLRDAPPRSTEVCERVGAKHGSWWGFAAYGALYAVSAMAFGLAMAVYVVFEPLAHWVTGKPEYADLSTGWWVAIIAASVAVSAPLSAIPFLRWVRRRRTDLAILARNGELVPADVVAGTTIKVVGAFGRGGDYATRVVVRTARATFRANVGASRGKTPEWFAVGAAVDVVAMDGIRYALLVGPDGSDYLATRK